MSDPTPALVASKATLSDAIDLNAMTVIGVIHTSAEPAAILRSAQGDIARVEVGAAVFGVFITAIGDSQVLVTDQSGQTKSLVVAGG